VRADWKTNFISQKMLLRHFAQNLHRNHFLLLALCVIVALTPANFARADDVAPSPQDAQREQAVADYTQKMRDANLPALFDKAAAEFNVPPDVLKAVSFAETRWTQLLWPDGEGASPENGMPHAYGIMSLWDNDYFGHSLTQAAQLIGQDPQMLKTDLYQNMRGGAALLRQLYDQTPKPEDATDPSQIESWRRAIAKYTGIPQPELSESHALRVYEYMNLGFHQYGIEWDAHPVNLGPMRADVARIKAAAHAPPSVQVPTNAIAPVAAPPPKPVIAPPPVVPPPAPVIAVVPPAPTEQDDTDRYHQRWLLLSLMLVLAVIGVWRFMTRKG
jgi:hypothetical protein